MLVHLARAELERAAFAHQAALQHAGRAAADKTWFVEALRALVHGDVHAATARRMLALHD